MREDGCDGDDEASRGASTRAWLEDAAAGVELSSMAPRNLPGTHPRLPSIWSGPAGLASAT